MTCQTFLDERRITCVSQLGCLLTKQVDESRRVVTAAVVKAVRQTVKKSKDWIWIEFKLPSHYLASLWLTDQDWINWQVDFAHQPLKLQRSGCAICFVYKCPWILW